jgi:hypothetical protein
VLQSAWHGVWANASSMPWIAVGVATFLVVTVVRVVHAAGCARNDRDPQRMFSRADRAVILSRAGERCEHYSWATNRCVQTEHLEAVHIHPHSRGGQTAVVNGHALCRAHNWTRRATIPFTWQLRALERRRAVYFPAGIPGTVLRRANQRAPLSGRRIRLAERSLALAHASQAHLFAHQRDFGTTALHP